MTLVVSIESPLGGGKGFFLKYCRQQTFSGLQVAVLLQDDSIATVMDMNTDPQRWSCFAELHFLLMHVAGIHHIIHPQPKSVASSPAPDVLLIEGSPRSDYACYMVENPAIDPLEKELYTIWYDILVDYWTIDVYLRLKSSIHSHYDRMIGNSKKEQSFVTLGYLASKYISFEKCLHGQPFMLCENNFEDNEPVLEVMKGKLEHLIRTKLASHHRGESPGTHSAQFGLLSGYQSIKNAQ